VHSQIIVYQPLLSALRPKGSRKRQWTWLTRNRRVCVRFWIPDVDTCSQRPMQELCADVACIISLFSPLPEHRDPTASSTGDSSHLPDPYRRNVTFPRLDPWKESVFAIVRWFIIFIVINLEKRPRGYSCFLAYWRARGSGVKGGVVTGRVKLSARCARARARAEGVERGNPGVRSTCARRYIAPCAPHYAIGKTLTLSHRGDTPRTVSFLLFSLSPCSAFRRILRAFCSCGRADIVIWIKRETRLKTRFLLMRVIPPRSQP